MKIRLLPLVIVGYGLVVIAKIIGVISDLSPKYENEISIISELGSKEAIASTGASSATSEGNDLKRKDKDQLKDREVKFVRDNTKISNVKPPDITNNSKECSDVELDLLQTLSERRKELEAWVEDAKNKENILNATSAKIDTKLNELKALRAELQDLLSLYNEKESLKIKSLVKIYESMKPGEAAAIFEKLDMNVLLQVIDNMKEAKVAPILGKLSPTKAREVTTEFANQKKLN
jgi:flagellar motility protein MotE (MotC chaperone)